MAVDVGTSVNFDVGPALAGLQKLADADSNLRSEQLKTNAAISQSFTTVAQSVQQYESQLGAILMDTRAASNAQQQFSRDIAGLVKEIRDQAAAQNEARRAAAESAAERRKANAEARAAAKAEKEAAKEVAAAEKEAAAAARLAAKEAAAAAAEANKGGGVLGKLSGVFGSLQGQVVAAFSVAAVKEFFKEVNDNAIAADATLSRLRFANGGDGAAAGRDLAFIRFEANRLGLELNSAGKSYGSFVAAASAADFPLAEARRLFLSAAGASSALKLSQDDTNGVLLALNQILSKGTVQAEELRGQIGERLPGAFAIAARAMGVTEQQLNKLLETGQVKAAEFLPKFATELQKTFGDGTAAAFDAAIANQSRFENEYNAFLLRFQGATGAATSKAAEYFRRFNEGLDLKSNEGRTRLGEKAAQPGIQAYEAVLNDLVKQAEAEAKKNGTDVTFAIGFRLAQQRNALEAQAAEARKALVFFDTTTKQGNLNAANFRGGLTAFRQAEVQARERISLLEGEISKLDEVAAARKKADSPTELEGLIKKQQELIKALKVRQLAATQENEGGGKDFLLGKGGLDEQIKEAEKELDRLLGKVDKAAKAAADKLAAALRALAAAQAELQNKAAAAATKDADDAALRARLNFEEQLRQVELIKQKLIERENAVRKAGGRGSRADGVIDGAQDEQLATLRVAALDKYYDELGKIERAREQRLFELRAQDNQKEIDTVNRLYDAKLAAQHLGQSRELDLLDEAAGIAVDKQRKRSQEELAIEEARQRDLLAVRFKQQQTASDQSTSVATARIQQAGNTFGAGTGISVIEAKQAEKRALLEIEQKHAQDVLQNSLLLNTREGELARAQADATIARVGAELKAIDQEKAKHKATDGFFKLVFGENDSEELRSQFEQTAQAAIGAISQILAAQLQAEQQKIQLHQENITNLQSQLAAEIQLNEQGSASNIKGIQDQIAAEKQAKGEALQESKRIAKQQQLVNDLQAVSSISLAVANVIAGWSEIPLVGSILGIVAAGAMVASFVATKSAAADAARTPGFFVGGYTGGESIREERGVVHGKEFVFDNEKTAAYRTALFEPLHTGRVQDIDWSNPVLSAILPDLELPERMRAEKANFVLQQQATNLAPLHAKFDALHDRLSAIEGSNARMAERSDKVPLGDGRYVELWENGSMKLVKVGG